MKALRESIEKHEKKLEELKKAYLTLQNVCEHQHLYDESLEKWKCAVCGHTADHLFKK